MSKWGLTYKGVEVLSPAEWNAVVDALEELDKRTPLEWNGGLAVFSGDGSTTEFLIGHGLSAKPDVVIVGAGSPDAKDISHWTVDDTYIHVFFSVAPPSGENNVSIWWLALRKS